MKNLQNQTKQAFLFSLGFYLLAMMLILFKVSFGPIMFSIALLVSLIWVFMTIREVLISTRIAGTERAFSFFLLYY